MQRALTHLLTAVTGCMAPPGLWNFNTLTAGTTLQNSDGTTVIKRGTTPCALPADASTGAAVCPDVWITGAGGADVPALVPGKFDQGLNIASGLLNWGESLHVRLCMHSTSQCWCHCNAC